MNKCDFSLVLKVCREFDDVSSAGRLFHVRALRHKLNLLLTIAQFTCEGINPTPTPEQAVSPGDKQTTLIILHVQYTQNYPSSRSTKSANKK